MNLSNEELKDLWREESLADDNDAVLYEVVEQGEWEDQGKFSTAEIIFKELATGKHFSFHIYRSGSYFSFYEFEVHDGAEEVEQIEETITIKKWVTV
jgi:hypothetical protein